MSRIDLSGIYPPIITTFKDDERNTLCLENMGENFKKWSKVGFRGYVVLGSNGEFPSMSREEKIKLMKFCRNLIPKNQLLIAGAGLEGTQETIDLCEEFGKLGVDAVLIVNPCYYKSLMTDTALFNHYTLVANASPVPVILYNMPGNTGIDLSIDLIIRLADHQNIIGLKDSSGNMDKMAELNEKLANKEFQVLAGSAGFLVKSFQRGAVGGVCALANCLGEPVVELYQKWVGGEKEEAERIQAKIVEPNLKVTREMGVPALKHMMHIFGYQSGPPRGPLMALNEEQKTNVEDCFRKHGFLK